MPKRYFVTIKLPGDDYDDCIGSECSSYFEAVALCADCAQSIDSTLWDACLNDNEGSVCPSLADFEDRWGHNNVASRVGFTIASYWGDSNVRKYCSGDRDWDRCKGGDDIPAPPPVINATLTAVLSGFADTIEATGGIIQDGDGCDVPAGCEDWPDLAAAYLAACNALGRKPS